MTGNQALSDVLDRGWSKESARIAVREGDRTLTFGELLRWSQAVSRCIAPALQEPGQRVALLLPNSAAFAAAFTGVARLGGIAAPLSTQYRSQELAHYLSDLDAAAVLTLPALAARVEACVAGSGRMPAIFAVANDREVALLRPGRGDRGHAPRSADSPALIQQYTSGSTGNPKRVVRTHAALHLELEALRTTFETSADDRFLGIAPFSHVNGLVRTLLSALYTCATLYPLTEFNRREVLDVITRERITFLGAVPQVFAVLSQTPPRGEVDLRSLRVVFSSSAPLLPEDGNRFRARYGIVVRQLYGSTETGSVAFNSTAEPDMRLESVGAPIDGVRVEVLDEKGRAVADNAEGEFSVTSPYAASGYAGNELATRESFRDGAFLTGDLGTKDSLGRLTITGRRKLMLNRGGFKVNPYEVEAAIREHPKVVDVAVYGARSPQGDDVVCAAIVTSGACTAGEILTHCRQRIADYKIPARIEFREALPRSAAGKVLRTRL